MVDSEKKAMQLMDEADKKLRASRGFLGALFGSGTRIEEACEAYTRAGNMFKVAKNWSQAGNAFLQAASLYFKSGSPHDAATCYLDAGNCYKKIDPKGAINCTLKAIEIYTDMGKFTMAAKHHVNVAEIYESEMADINKAITHFEQAADYFKGEESNSSANKCLLKVAHYAAQMEQYEKAIQIYEQVGAQCLDSSLLKYSAKDHFFRASLCHLCVDLLNAQHALAKYEDMYPAFTDCREYKLIKNLMTHIEDQNVDGYTEVVKDYDSISRLDQWYTCILLRIKKAMADNPDLR